ncbi:MAG: AbrB/MazE/SpoVT family DNA-binding domain-containing protein [Angustibacter sp.]
MDTHICFASVQPKSGTVTIPAQLRRQLGLDQPGAQVRISLQEGSIVLTPYISIPADQAWFWSPEWQKMEHEAESDVKSGRVTQFADEAAFLEHLDRIVRPS